MQPRTLKITTDLGEFGVEPWNGVNESGFDPEGDRVLVLPDQAVEQTAGGIYVADDTRERVTAAAETGVIVAIGPEAFVWNTDRTRRRESPPPQAGQRIFFSRYSGGILHGKDGRIYRVMDDKAVGAIERPTAMPISAAKEQAA